MRWVTREQVRVGRMGCAWLIRRFIDHDAEILTVPGPEVISTAERIGATPFHAHGVALKRQGDRSSFEVLLAAYHLEADPALALLGQIVNTADVHPSPFNRPEGAGLKAITDGFTALFATDDERLRAGAQVFDGLYRYCEQAVERASGGAAPAGDA
ncbi:MAG TPA: chromate resistance protein ChrB domain-containing protein [Ktedonobacterales bacterium]|jgi:hypothetical protein